MILFCNVVLFDELDVVPKRPAIDEEEGFPADAASELRREIRSRVVDEVVDALIAPLLLAFAVAVAIAGFFCVVVLVPACVILGPNNFEMIFNFNSFFSSRLKFLVLSEIKKNL